MFSYTAYGLGIHSELPLPELTAAESAGDITIRLELNYNSLPQPLGNEIWPLYNPEEAIWHLEKIGVFIMRGGREVIVHPEPNVEDSLIRHCLSGVVMGVLLSQRGKLVLHASSAQVHGSAVAFLGNSGWGKSSIAAAMVARGHGLIADDVTAVDLAGCAPTVLPGVPQLKINPEVAAALGIDPASLRRLFSGEMKRRMPIEHTSSNTPIPLGRIYVLDEGAEPGVVPLRRAEAVVELVSKSYPTRIPEQQDTTRLLNCAGLAKKVPVSRLKRTEDLLSLPDLARLVEEDMTRLGKSASHSGEIRYD